jgi:hypothetical protein
MHHPSQDLIDLNAVDTSKQARGCCPDTQGQQRDGAGDTSGAAKLVLGVT